MSETFQEALAKIIGQQVELKDADERAVESIVVDPLLRSLGWDTATLSEVYPQWTMPNSENAVDYSLRINGKNRVFIEVKQWPRPLRPRFERQLQGYCSDAGKEKPQLAILTNGQLWRFYLRPLSPGRNNNIPNLRRFLQLDIVNDSPDLVGGRFGQILSRENLQPGGGAIAEARRLLVLYNNSIEIMNKLTTVWNKLARTRRGQETLLSQLASQNDIPAQKVHIKRLVDLGGSLFNQTPIKTGRKTSQNPTSFTFHPNGEEPIPVKSLAECVRKLSILLYERHPSDFDKRILAINRAWVSKESDKQSRHFVIGDSGVAVLHKGSAAGKENICKMLVEQLGYPPKSLIIHYPDTEVALA